MVRGIYALVLGIAVVSAFIFWIASVRAHFKAVANRRADVTWYRAWRWPMELAFGRNIYLEDLFTDIGRKWLRKSLRYLGGFFAAWAIGMAAGLISKFTSE